jgi:hypothetical protein
VPFDRGGERTVSIPDGNGVTVLQHANAQGYRVIARLLAGR